tara:strand:+ start:10729 stop:11172 length:444 start_codon:yes stop_codon:yes gene_type:complete
MANSIPTKTTLKKGDNLPARGKGKKSLMLEAIRSVCGNEEEFLKKVVTVGLGDIENDAAPNPALITLVLNRIEPPLKAISPMVKFELDPNGKPHESALQILTAISKGELAADVGNMLITSITSMLKIQEVTDLEDRIKAIEAASAED